MTPTKTRNKIKKRIEDGSFTVGKVIVESKYTGLRKYLDGGEISHSHLYDVEQALTRLEAEKDA